MNLSRTILVVAAFAAMTSSRAHGSDRQPHEFGWMIVNHENTSMSSMRDLDDLEGLKRTYGDEFLFVRDGDDRYVIRDPALMKRAWEAQRPVGEAGRRVGREARAQALEALSGWDDDADRVRLGRKVDKLSRKIDRAEARGESAGEIERERAELERVRQSLSDDRQAHGHRHETGHESRQQDADEDLDRAIKTMKREVRDIFREARSRHLAERVE